MINCWYTRTCAKVNTGMCSQSCIRLCEMIAMMEYSGIPKNRQQPDKLIPQTVDKRTFIYLNEIKEDIETFINNGESLYIFSDNNGNGKTSWAIKLMLKHFDNVWAGNGFRRRGVFVHVPSFLTSIQNNIRMPTSDFTALCDDLAVTDLVVWDDIGSTRLSDYDHKNLLVYIDQRKLARLPNIYTGNLEDEALQAAVGHRLYSRIWNDSTRIELLGSDRRG